MLQECDLLYVHIDERDPSITAVFEFPMDQDTLEFCLEFCNAGGLHISGWSHEPPTSFVLSELETGGDLISVSGPGVRLEFHCDSVSIFSVRKFKSGPI
jgi:hypothetical protein